MKKHSKKIYFNLAKELYSPSEENNNWKYPPNISLDLNVINKNNTEEDNIYEEIKSFFGGPYIYNAWYIIYKLGRERWKHKKIMYTIWSSINLW